MQAPHAGEDRARLLGAQPDDELNVGPHCRLHGFWPVIADVDAGLAHGGHGLIPHPIAWIRTRGPGPPARRREGVEQPLGHLRAGRVVRSDEQYSRHLTGCFSAWHWKVLVGRRQPPSGEMRG